MQKNNIIQPSLFSTFEYKNFLEKQQRLLKIKDEETFKNIEHNNHLNTA